MEKNYAISQKPNEEISRRRSTEINDSEKHSERSTKRQCIDLTVTELLLVFNNVMRVEARLQWVEE